MPSALLLPVVTCAAVLLVSGVAKLRAPASVDAAFTSLGVPRGLDTPLVRRLVPWVEVALGAWLLLATGPALVVVATLTLVLFVAYLVLVVRAVRRPEPADCGCFGALGDSEVTTVTVWRNAMLVLTAALAVLAGVRGEGLIGSLVEEGTLAWLAATSLTVVVAVLVTHRGAGSAAHAGHGEPVVGAVVTTDDGEYVRQSVPPLTFLDETGSLLSLERSVHAGAHLLVFLSPWCGACQDITPRIPEWAARLAPVQVKAVLVADPSALEEDHLAMLRGHAWFDPYSTARRQLGPGTPGAVLVGIDGLLAGGPVTGARDVVMFVDDVAEQLDEAGVIGEDGDTAADVADAGEPTAADEMAEVTDAR